MKQLQTQINSVTNTVNTITQETSTGGNVLRRSGVAEFQYKTGYATTNIGCYYMTLYVIKHVINYNVCKCQWDNIKM